MIAGLKKDKKEKEVKKIPMLGDIPGLGFLMRSTKDITTKTELVVFLTPRIVSGETPVTYESLTNDWDIIELTE
jgi:type II secretory pathway component GspD/PulD (secretin)